MAAPLVTYTAWSTTIQQCLPAVLVGRLSRCDPPKWEYVEYVDIHLFGNIWEYVDIHLFVFFSWHFSQVRH